MGQGYARSIAPLPRSPAMRVLGRSSPTATAVSMRARVTVMAVYILASTPMLNVSAHLRIGPLLTTTTISDLSCALTFEPLTVIKTQFHTDCKAAYRVLLVR